MEVPDLLVTVEGRQVRLTSDRKWTVGRDPRSDIVVGHSLVSRRHGEFVCVDGVWQYRDTASANHSWVDGESVGELRISGPVEIRLGRDTGALLLVTLAGGGAPVGARRPTTGQPSLGSSSGDVPSAQPRPIRRPPDTPTQLLRLTGSQLSIGRAPDNDVAVSDLLVSRHHAAIRRLSGDRFELVDLGSTNGTYLNGKRVTTAELHLGDLVSVGGRVFRFAPEGITERLDPAGPWLCAMDVGVALGSGKVLVHPVRFALEPRRLMAIAGPSGAGKSTLLRALTGQEPTDIGTVIYGGRNLYSSLDLRQKMGYVPQQDLLHTQLTAREALEYAAELRFARDVDATTRSARIDEVVDELGLAECQFRQVGQLSGGERKRTSIAAELLTTPPLIFLDEPTSGLDPGNELQVTQLLRSLADSGKTVVAATHSLVTLAQCDQVLFLAKGGHEAFYGPPGQARDYFDKRDAGKDYPEVFDALNDEQRGTAFAATFSSDPAAKANVERPLAAARVAAENPAAHALQTPPNTDWLRQWWVLVRRYLAVLRSDRVASLILLAQAPFFALLFNILYPTNMMSSANASEATILVWLMVIGATWIGTSNAIREIVKEDAILRREHGLGLSLASYLASKVAVLGALTAVECAFLALATLLPVQRIPAVDPIGNAAIPGGGVLITPAILEVVVDVVLAGLAAMGLGLLISAVVKTADQANFALPMLLVAQVVLSAPVLGSPGPVFSLLGTASTAQWSTAATAATLSLNDIRRPYLQGVEAQRAGAEHRPPDPSVERGRDTWDHSRGAWLLNVGALVAGLVLTVGAAYGVLVAKHRMRTRS